MEYEKLLISFLAWLMISTIALAADFQGIGGKPAHPNPSIPYSDQWFIYSIKPGESKKDELIVQNNTSEPVDIMLYPADSTPSTDGGFALEQMVETRDFVGAWIKLSKDAIHLRAQESAVIPFTISVPNDPKLDVGEHTGGILIQKIKQEKPAEEGMQLLTRVGVRVYVIIPGEIIKRLDIEKFTVALDKEKKIYITTAVVKNSGNVSRNIKILTRVTNVYSWLDRFFEEFPLENGKNLQVLRDSSLVSNFEFPKPPWGKLKVEGIIDYENNTESLSAVPLEINVPPDRNIIILLVAAAAFFISIILLIKIKKYDRKKKMQLKTKK